MKSSTQFLRCLTVALVGSCAAFCPTLVAQTTATTDPVGFITLTVAGTGGTVASQLSFLGTGLTRSVEYQGSAEAVGTASLTDNDATWTDNQFNGANGAYFVELTSGAGAGTTYDIATTVQLTKTITTVQNLAAGVTAGVTFKIRKHWTIASVFGAANEAGLQAGTATDADVIRVYNGTGYDGYYYATAQPPFITAGWRKVSGGNTDYAGQRLYPDDGLLLTRKQVSNVPVVLMGAVKTGVTSFPVLSGLNIVANPYAAPMTLGTSVLYTGNSVTGISSGPAGGATTDEVRIYNPSTGNYDAYYYATAQPPFITAGWRKIGGGNTDQVGVTIPVGSSILVTRKAAGNFDWVSPQHPTTL